MDESVIKHFEEQQAAVVPVSEWIRRGIPLVNDYKFGFISMDLDDRPRGCALGAAYYAKTRRTTYRFADGGKGNGVSDELGLPRHIFLRASGMHATGSTREEVADWLESQGL